MLSLPSVRHGFWWEIFYYLNCFFSLLVRYHFFLIDFKIFFLYLFFRFFSVIYLGLNFFIFILFGVCAASWSCRVFFAKFWGFRTPFWTLFNPSFFLLCWNSIGITIRSYIIVPHVSVIQLCVKGDFYCLVFNFNASFLFPVHSADRLSIEFFIFVFDFSILKFQFAVLYL